jgi:FKBP-type peptidyl-prolyl cis-trans isomerase FkpA
MISRLLIFISFCVVLSSCKKSDDPGCNYTPSTLVVPASEMTTLQNFIAAYHPSATLSSGGFYYDIVSTGSGTVTPVLCSSVSVKYAGYYSNGVTSGTKFTSVAEESNVSTFALGNLILGWQRGIPLIKAGGTINLYLPPSLGYGAGGSGTIPGNSILIFTIQLTAVQ